MDVFNSINFYATKNDKECIYVKIISQECITKYKWILKAKKAESFQDEINASFFAHRYTLLKIYRNVPSHVPAADDFCKVLESRICVY